MASGLAGQMGRQIAGKMSQSFSFAKKIPMLLKATSDDDQPTSGYLYQEISHITYESISSCISLLDFLLGRLKKQSPLIRYKVLKIMCYLATNGHSEFRSGLRHNADLVRETASFTGPINQLTGDAFNQRVRTTALELIEVLFNVESSGEPSFVSAMAGPTGKKMEGFGNSPSPSTKNNTWLHSIKQLANTLPEAANLLISKDEKEKPSTSHHGNEPTAGADSCVSFVNYHGLTDSDLAFGRLLKKEDSIQSFEVPEVEAEHFLSTEVHLVNEITSEGGIRAVPSKDTLSQFTKRCATLSLDKILEALNNRLEEPVTEIQLKSLHVLEHLLKSDLPDVTGKMLYCCTNLQEISKEVQGNVTAKATKILAIITARKQQKQIRKDVPGLGTDFQLLSDSRLKEPWNSEVTREATCDSSERSRTFHDNATLFSGMSIYGETAVDSRASDSVQEENNSLEVSGLFHGLNLPSQNYIDRENIDLISSLENPHCNPHSEHLSAVSQQPVDDQMVDLFDPLYCRTTNRLTDSKPCSGLSDELSKLKLNDLQLVTCGNQSLLVQSVTEPSSSYDNSSSLTFVSSGLTSFSGASIGPENSVSPIQSVSPEDNLTVNRTVHPRAQLSSRGLRMVNLHHGNLPGTFYPSTSPLTMSSTSTIPWRLPKQSSQKSDFDFIGKSGKADAFSFVQDEMKARK